MASLDWHKMNNIVCEIERNRERMNRAILHANEHRGGLVAGMIGELKSRHEALYDELYDHTEAWLKKLKGAVHEKQSY